MDVEPLVLRTLEVIIRASGTQGWRPTVSPVSDAATLVIAVGAQQEVVELATHSVKALGHRVEVSRLHGASRQNEILRELDRFKRRVWAVVVLLGDSSASKDVSGALRKFARANLGVIMIVRSKNEGVIESRFTRMDASVAPSSGVVAQALLQALFNRMHYHKRMRRTIYQLVLSCAAMIMILMIVQKASAVRAVSDIDTCLVEEPQGIARLLTSVDAKRLYPSSDIDSWRTSGFVFKVIDVEYLDSLLRGGGVLGWGSKSVDHRFLACTNENCDSVELQKLLDPRSCEFAHERSEKTMRVPPVASIAVSVQGGGPETRGNPAGVVGPDAYFQVSGRGGSFEIDGQRLLIVGVGSVVSLVSQGSTSKLFEIKSLSCKTAERSDGFTHSCPNPRQKPPTKNEHKL